MSITAAARCQPRLARELPATPYLVVLSLEACLAGALLMASRGRDVLWLAVPIGWLGLGSMTLMQLYSLRRRIRLMKRWGSIRSWLDWHIFMGIQGGICITYHSARIETWWSASGAGLVLMWIVLLSGGFGRYLFALVPRMVSGDAMTTQELDAELRTLAAQLPDAAPWAEIAAIDQGTSAWQAVARSWQVRTVLQAFARRLADRTAPERARMLTLIRRRRRLALRQPTILAAERALRWWLLFHRPLVFLLATAAMLHVIAHFAFMAVQ